MFCKFACVWLINKAEVKRKSQNEDRKDSEHLSPVFLLTLPRGMPLINKASLKEQAALNNTIFFLVVCCLIQSSMPEHCMPVLKQTQ